MNHRFTLPVALAVSVHATLLLGFRHPRPGIVSPPQPKNTVRIIPNPDLPDVPEVMDVSLSQVGVADSFRPTQEDQPRTLKPLDFVMSTSPQLPSIKVPNKFENTVLGNPGGIEDGRQIAVGSIVPSALLDNVPNARVQGPPAYPFAARRDGRSGEVWVEFIVDETGRVVNPTIVRSNDREFDEPSLRAVAKWRFEPGKQNGRIVRFRMAVPVVFRLDAE